MTPYQLLLEVWCISYGLVHSEKFWAMTVACVFVFVSFSMWRKAVAE